MSYTDRYVQAAEAVSAAASHRAAWGDKSVLTPLEFHEEVRRVADLMADGDLDVAGDAAEDAAVWCRQDGCPERADGIVSGFCRSHEPF